MFGLVILFSVAYALLVLLCTAAIVLQIVRPRRKTFAVALAWGLPTQPSELGLEGEEAVFNLPGGHTSPGWIIEGEKADGPTVLVLHGHRDAACGALPFAQALSRYAAHVVVFDWPAHGGCSAKWMTCGVREPGDAVAVLDGLPDALRERPVVLFGYSLGGQIAVKTAAVHDRFAGVIIDGAYRRWDTPIRLKLKQMRVPAWPMMALVGLVFWLTGMTRRFDRAAYAQRIDKPVLVLHGSDDRICPIEEGRELAEHAPDAAFVSFEGGQHNRLLTADPKRYHAALDTFFKTITDAPRA